MVHGRLGVFTLGTVLAYGTLEAVVVHRIARFEEEAFSLATVTAWAAVARLLTLPGRFALPVLARRVRSTDVLTAVLLVLAASTALMIAGSSYARMAISFVLFGLVFGAALPLRAVVMGDWRADRRLRLRDGRPGGVDRRRPRDPACARRLAARGPPRLTT